MKHLKRAGMLALGILPLLMSAQEGEGVYYSERAPAVRRPVESGHFGISMDYSDFVTSGEYNSYFHVAVRQRTAIPMPYLREADVKFSRRIIRCIDARQKMNKSLEWPRSPLNTYLRDLAYEGAIVPYRNDSLASFYYSTDMRERFSREVLIWVQDDPSDITIGHDSMITISLDWADIHKFWVMEDWIFDYKHSVFKPVIIAIAPVVAPDYNGIKTREQPMCWFKMDDLRQMFSNKELFNRYNDGARLSYDDFFQARLFDSYIIYESNVFDNYINQYQEYAEDGVGALLRADEIRNDLFIFEHDLWQF